MRSLVIALSAALLFLPACKKADPNSVADQIERLQKAKGTKERLSALERLRNLKNAEAVPGLIDALKANQGEVREKIAVILGELKDPRAVGPLAESIDFAVTSGSDKASKEANAANKEIARALGELGDKGATDALVKLLKVTKDQYVKIETINALGKLKDPRALDLLSEIATDERLEPYINKKAILALASINDPKALPVYFKMAFAERKGVSFYAESSFAIFLLGDAAKDKVLAALAGEDKELLAWAKERDILEPAIYAKAAQIEADLQDPRAIPHLIKLLKYEDPNPMYQAVVRLAAADTLGRMRAKEAVRHIGSMLNVDEANVRSAFVRALVQIGDKSVVPNLVRCAASGSWSAREYCMLGVALLGEEKDLKSFDAFLKAEPGRFDAECKDGYYGNVDCAAEREKNVEARTKTITGYRQVVEMVAACSDDQCFEKALASDEPVVRERAAYELGRRQAAGSVPALLEAVKRPVANVVDLNPRFAAICAIDWITAANKEAMAAGKAAVEALDAQVEEESKKVMTQKIAEELKRLSVKLARG